ncbi:MAG: hypothetical protein NC084_05595 [Bacteroides sp.]|nr:hypothetical protein [Eubacterium sp.]MCM1418006.1 hypothetical protein [Roseburia sp.]MCM1462171.1 hypothetical protein [Bacteroides sp.]
MDKLRVQVNGRGYYLKTDNRDEVLSFAKSYEDKILYIMTKMPGISEAEATALSALLLMGDSLKKTRSDEDEALIAALNEKIEVLEERIGTLNGEVDRRHEAESALNAEIEQARADRTELERRLSDANEQGRALSEQYSGNLNEIADVKAALSSANKLIAQLNTEKLTEVAANEALRNELDGAQGRLENANKTIAELNGKLTKMEIHSDVSDDAAEIPEELRRLRREKEDLEIELAIANEEIEKLKNSADKPSPTEAELSARIEEYEKKLRRLESRSGEMDKLRAILAETEHSVRQKTEEKEEENQKLRNILKNYESSYGICMARKEEEIIALQDEIEKLKDQLSIKDERLSAAYVQTTFDS